MVLRYWHVMKLGLAHHPYTKHPMLINCLNSRDILTLECWYLFQHLGERTLYKFPSDGQFDDVGNMWIVGNVKNIFHHYDKVFHKFGWIRFENEFKSLCGESYEFSRGLNQHAQQVASCSYKLFSSLSYQNWSAELRLTKGQSMICCDMSHGCTRC